MTIWAGLGSVGTVVGGTAAAAVVVVGGVMGVRMMTAEPDNPEPVVVEASVAPSVAPEGDATPIETAPSVDPKLPSFDLVRVDADGSALVAGRAMPRADVLVLIDGAEAYKATADGSGSFAAIFFVEPVDKPRVVSLTMIVEGKDPIKSSATVILAPVKPAPDVAVVPVETPVTSLDKVDVAEVVSSTPVVEDGAANIPPSANVDPDPDTVDLAVLVEPAAEVVAAEGLPAEKPDAGVVIGETVPATIARETAGPPLVVIAKNAVEATPSVGLSDTSVDTLPGIAGPAAPLNVPLDMQPILDAGLENSDTKAPELPLETAIDAVTETIEVVPSDPVPELIVDEPPAETVSVAVLDETLDVIPSESGPELRVIEQPAETVVAEVEMDDPIEAGPDPVETDSAPVVSAEADPGKTVASTVVEAVADLSEVIDDAKEIDTLVSVVPDNDPVQVTTADPVETTNTLDVTVSSDLAEEETPSVAVEGAETVETVARTIVADETDPVEVDPVKGVTDVLVPDTTETEVEPVIVAAIEPDLVETPTEIVPEVAVTPNEIIAETGVGVELSPVETVVQPETPALVVPSAPVIEASDISIGESPSFEAPGVATETAPTILASADTAPVPATPSAPSVLLADDTGIRVLQSGGDAPTATQTVIIDTISYDPAGDVALGGRGAGAGFVRVYLNNKPIKTTRIGIDGQWSTPLPEVDTGVYTLRVDEIDEAGVVTSRMETPFKREEPEIVAALDTRQNEAREDTGVVTVQPGNTLWGIASEKYGDGLLYVRVFEANRERIRNADLIYPGQIFEVPE